MSVEVNCTQSIAQLTTTYQSRSYFEQSYFDYIDEKPDVYSEYETVSEHFIVEIREKTIAKFFFWYKRKTVYDQLWCSKNQNFIVFFFCKTTQ